MVCTVAVFLLAGAYTWFSSSSRGNIISSKLSKHLILPALFNGRHQEPLAYSKYLSVDLQSYQLMLLVEIGYAPSRINSLLITLYVIMNIIFCCVPYKSVQPSAWYSDKRGEIAAYITNRTGVLSFANIALSILFAGRNNPLIYITGLSQTTCLIFHRWAARVATLQAIVHSVCNLLLSMLVDRSSTDFHCRSSILLHIFGLVELQHITQKQLSPIIGGESSLHWHCF